MNIEDTLFAARAAKTFQHVLGKLKEAKEAGKRSLIYLLWGTRSNLVMELLEAEGYSVELRGFAKGNAYGVVVEITWSSINTKETN